MNKKHFYWLLALFFLIADQASKAWATAQLKPIGAMEIIPGFFRFSYALNRGVAFSLFANVEFNIKWILAAISALAALAVAIYLAQTPPHHWRLCLALALLLSGIIGNLVDRVRLGEVVDFIEFHWIDRFIWPTFNIADAVICIGAFFLALEMLREERNTRQRQAALLKDAQAEIPE